MTITRIQSASQPARVLHVTDPHLFATTDGCLRGTNTHDSLMSVLQHIRDSDWPADLMAVTGDLIQDDTAGAYEQFRDIFSTLGMPVACIPGNHDIPSLMQSALDREPFSYCAVHELGNWVVVGIDSSVAGTAEGRVPESELSRLIDSIEASPAEHALVCLHHPPILMGSRWLDSVGLKNGSGFLQILYGVGKIRALLSGHVHQDYDCLHNNIRVMATPSTCRQFKKNSDVFMVDDNPPAYRRITLNPDGSLESELIWV